MNLEPLFRAVYDAPGEDAPKHVLADALQLAADPRGDFIALQLRDSVISRRRCDKLLARNRQAFLGALAACVVNPMDPRQLERTHERWAKGFLVECTVRLAGETTDCLEWATLRTLHVFERADPPDELASPHLRSLREVFVYGSDAFADRARAFLASGGHAAVRVTHVERLR